MLFSRDASGRVVSIWCGCHVEEYLVVVFSSKFEKVEVVGCGGGGAGILNLGYSVQIDLYSGRDVPCPYEYG